MQNGNKPKPLLISGFSSVTLAEDIAQELGTRVVNVSRKQFPDKEIQTTIEENVRGHEVVVVASASGDPNKQEKEARLLMRAAKRAGAKKVTLFLPYMWYGRSDDMWDERNSPALTDTIETLRPHCDDVIIADPHNHGATREKFLDAGGSVKTCLPIHFAYTSALQIRDMIEKGIISKDNLLLSHADAGSTKRISRSFRAAVYNVLDMDRNFDQDDWPQGLKDRDKATGKSRYKGFSADVKGQDIVIFEDMIGTGGTACELAEQLKDLGAASVHLFATSGLFTAKEGLHKTASVERINASKLDSLFITDTYNHKATSLSVYKAIEHSPIIHTSRSAPYLASILEALHVEVSDGMTDENSISAILRGRHPDQLSGTRHVSQPCAYKPGSPLWNLIR